MPSPKNSFTLQSGVRAYRWEPIDGSEPTDVLSVTSIRRICGHPDALVAWQLANILDVAMSTIKRTVIGPRGGVKEVRVIDEFPGEFLRRYMETEGTQAKMDDLRRWVRAQADEPRNIAAARGTIVHETIEKNIRADRVERPYVESAFSGLSDKDKKRVGNEVTDQDVEFVRSCMYQYEDMRAHVPFVILAREPQVWNLTAGYGGSTDVMIWFLPEGTPLNEVMAWQRAADKGTVTIETIRKYGGRVVLGDWKTSSGIFLDHVIQVTAYLGAEFIGTDGVVDQRLTDILEAMMEGALIHIRPDKWSVDYFPMREDILQAFLGQCIFARCVALHPSITDLFSSTEEGNADVPEAE